MAAFHLAALFFQHFRRSFSHCEIVCRAVLFRRVSCVAGHHRHCHCRGTLPLLRSLSIKTPSNLHISAAVTAVNAGRDAGLIVAGIGKGICEDIGEPGKWWWLLLR